MSSSVDLIQQAFGQTGPGDPAISIGIVDGIPDLDCGDFRNARISIDATMQGDLSGKPDNHGTEICSLILGGEFGIGMALAAVAGNAPAHKVVDVGFELKARESTARRR